MAQAVDSTGTQTKIFSQMAFKGHVYTMAAAFVGVVLGVLGSMGFMANYLQSQFAAQTSALDKRLVSVAPTATYNACVVPSGSGSGAGAAKAAAATPLAAVTPETGGKGGDGGSGGGGTTPPFVSQLINGTISNTGPRSNNSITASNTYTSTTTNNNDVNVSNTNVQFAGSGAATSGGNTEGGSAQSGDVHNEHSAETTIGIKN